MPSHSQNFQAAEEVEVINLNSFSDESIAHLDPHTADLVRRRNEVMGSPYRLVFEEPFQPVRAKGTRMFDARDNEYLDVYNNVVSIGHNNDHVVKAVMDQLSKINTNTRYLQEDIILYAEDLVSTHADELTNVMFTCTGSEANDLAVRIAKAYTKNTGVIVSDYAYHGNTTEVSSWSPASGRGNYLGDYVRTVLPPDYFRNPETAESAFLTEVEQQILNLKTHGQGTAAVIVDSLFSSDGIYPIASMMPKLLELAHSYGALLICDEVQAGFSRTGKNMWGYQNSGITPDIVTMGKPMGNGIPIGGVVAKKVLAENFGNSVAYFNTFGGENVPVAAAQAVLDFIRDQKLGSHVERMSEKLATSLARLLEKYEVPSDVRYQGLYIGVEIVTDMTTKTPDMKTATKIINQLKEQRVITSSAGKYGNVLKIRPPIIFNDEDLSWLLEAFENVLQNLHKGGNAAEPSLVKGSGGESRSVTTEEEMRRLILEELQGLIGEVSRG